MDRPFTVVGYRLDTGETFVAWLEEGDVDAAIAAAERQILGDDPPAWEVCAVFAGHHDDLNAP